VSNLLSFLSPQNIIESLGAFATLGIMAIVFAESGLFFGFFFPGDSLLFTAGFLASQGILPTWPLVAGVFIAAVIGDNFGYAFGKKVGVKIFSKDNSLFFDKKYPAQAQAFYEKYGKKTLILARFIPIVRTFAPIMAGVGEMKYRTFFIYNIVGGALWTVTVIGAGFILGRTIPNADQYISIIVLVIIVISVLPALGHFIKANRKK
jgi:membrane-associated protein